MSFDCLPLLLGLLLLISVVDCRDGERHHRHNWLVAAIPTEDGDDDGSQLRQAMDDFVKRVQPELEVRDTVFDLTTVAQMPATTAPTTTTTTTTVRPVRSSDRPLPPHPYMQMLYEEIDDRRNEKWVEMDNTGATIRGIEPIRVTTAEGEQTTALDFAIGTINDLDAIHHVDLVLTSSNYSSFESSSMESSSMESDENDVVEVYIQSLNDSTSPMKLMTYRKMATDDNRWSFLVLEMTPTIRDWWSNGHLKATQTIHLTSSNVHLQRPLLVFYYVTDKGVQDGGLRQQQRKKRSFPHSFGSSRTHTRPCSQRCVHAQRRQPPINETAKDGGHRSCTLRSWDVTLRDLQWEAKVVAPYSLQMNYCSGSCEAPIYDASYNATNHAVVRSVLLTQMHDAANSFPPPYCVPTSLEADTFMFLENEQFYIKNMDNIVAKKCGCR